MSVRYARFVTRHPVAVLLATVAALVAVAIPALDMKLGLPDDGSKTEETTERRAYDLLTEGFGPGFNGPLTVVVDAPDLTKEEQAEIATGIVEGLAEFPGVAAVSPASQNETGDLTVVQVTPSGSPASDETSDLVDALRAEADRIRAESGIEGYVTGTTALNIDTSDALASKLPLYIVVVVGLALLLLTVVFRSIAIPVKAVLGFLLTIAAATGLTVWIFQQGNLADLFSVAQPGPILSFLPVLMIGILFGLAMDYEVFLVSGMREEYARTGKAHEAIIAGYGRSGRVVVAAALIMIGVFGAYVLDPDPVTKSIGVSLAFGVFVDAFIVRLTLVPAAMKLLGDRAWGLPKRLERIIPVIDIEGESLDTGAEPDREEPEAPAPAPAPEPEPEREVVRS
jgi:RND superfamily putative drug exporter